MDIYEEILRLRRAGQKSALATIVQVNGSIPSFESAKMLVREDGSIVGTVGGGCVEADVWTAAREVIETEKPKHLTFTLGHDANYDTGLICGGQLNVFVEPVIPAPRAHLSSAVDTFRKACRKSRAWPDSRPSLSTIAKHLPIANGSPEADEVYSGDYEEGLSETDDSLLELYRHRHPRTSRRHARA